MNPFRLKIVIVAGLFVVVGRIGRELIGTVHVDPIARVGENLNPGN